MLITLKTRAHSALTNTVCELLNLKQLCHTYNNVYKRKNKQKTIRLFKKSFCVTASPLTHLKFKLFKDVSGGFVVKDVSKENTVNNNKNRKKAFATSQATIQQNTNKQPKKGRKMQITKMWVELHLFWPFVSPHFHSLALLSFCYDGLQCFDNVCNS